VTSADYDRVIAIIAAMIEPQRVRQVLVYAALLHYH
jgi:hypothetical protein